MAYQLDSSLNATTVTTALVSIGLASLVWWRRFVRLVHLRERVARLHSLSEEILDVDSAARIVELLDRRLSEILGPCRSAIYSYDAATGVLEAAAGAAAVPPAALQCQKGGRPGMTSEALYLPMFAQGRGAGVLELRSVQAPELQADERAALRHMANQAAISIRLLGQRQLRDQLLRSEQLGAAGVLVSNIASDLRPPLARILSLAREHGLPEAAAEAGAALETLDRILAIGHPEQARVQPFDLNLAVGQLVEFRSRAWRLRMIAAAVELSPGSLPVLGARGQIEQALLNLIVLAEQHQEESSARRIGLTTQNREGRAILLIAFPAPAPLDAGPVSSLAAVRSLVESHGGGWMQETRNGEARFEISLPLSAAIDTPSEAPAAKASVHPLTLLLAHPEPASLRPLITALGERGHRGVPAETAGQALDYASRLRFDALFASRSLPDLDWPALAGRAQAGAGLVGLLCGPAELAPAGIASLRVPLDQAELDRVLSDLAETA